MNINICLSIETPDKGDFILKKPSIAISNLPIFSNFFDPENEGRRFVPPITGFE